MFAVPRTCGWLAHWLEAFDDPEQKLMRPRQIYTGPERARLRLPWREIVEGPRPG